MYTVDNKYEIGEEVYSVSMQEIEYKCPYCNGSGIVKLELKESLKGKFTAGHIECEPCRGVGYSSKSKYRAWFVMDEILKISSIRVGIDDNGIKEIKYNCHGGGRSVKRHEYRLFITKTEAQEYCDELNKEIKFLKEDYNNSGIVNTYSNIVELSDRTRESELNGNN